MAKQVTIDKYGWPLIQAKIPDEAWHWYEHFYMIDESTPNTKYMCFTDADKRIIWRESKNASVTKLEFSYGNWDDKDNLTYVPINGALTVDV